MQLPESSSPKLYILSSVLVTRDGVRIRNWFIGSSLVVTTLNYYTSEGLHNLQSLHANLLSLSAVVFTYV
jgi:hypothetical protein